MAGRTVLPILALCTLLCALAAPRMARADDPRGDARAHYARGLELAAQNGYAGALREFNEAYTISPQYAVLYNIGQAHIALGQTAEAIEALTRYLRDGGDRVSPVRRTQVERQIARLRAELPSSEGMSEAEAARATAAAAGAAAGAASAEASEAAHTLVPRPGTLTIRCADPSLRVTLDGKHVDLATSTRGLPVAAGAHHLVLALAGRRPTEQHLTVVEGTATLVLCENLVPPLTLVPPPVPVGPPPPVPGPLSSESVATTTAPIVHARTVGYLLGGLGLALGGTSLGFYLWNRGQAQDAQDELQHLPKMGDPLFHDLAVQYDQDVDAVHRNNEFALGVAIVGAALLTGGVYLLVHERRSGEKTSVADVLRSWATIAPGAAAWNGVW
jgi:tetratricopeptide (TPR) repeat protein